MFVHSKIQKFLNLSSMLNIRCPRLPAFQIACKLFAIYDKIFALFLSKPTERSEGGFGSMPKGTNDVLCWL